MVLATTLLVILAWIAPASSADTVDLPEPVVAFLEEAPAPFGRLHPEAPPETVQFGQLAGVWRVVTHAYFNGEWYSGWPAFWVWKYTIDGFGIEDLWYQREEDLAPPIAELGRAFQILNLRVYDPTKQHWRVTWISNADGVAGRSSFGSFDGMAENDHIVMTPPKVEGESLRRVTFSDITDETFTWTSEVSEDGGGTWESTLRLEAKRVE